MPQHIEVSGNEAFTWASDTKLLITSNVTLLVVLGSAALPIRLQTVQSFDLAARKLTAAGPDRRPFCQDVIFIDPAGRYVLLSSLRADRPHPERLARRPRDRRRRSRSSRRGAASGAGSPTATAWSASASIMASAAPASITAPLPQPPLTLVETRRNLEDDSVIDTVRFVTNTSRGIIVTNAETGRFAVYDYDFATDTRGAALFSTSRGRRDPRPVTARTAALDGVVYEDDRPRVRWLNPELERLQARIDRTLPGPHQPDRQPQPRRQPRS